MYKKLFLCLVFLIYLSGCEHFGNNSDPKTALLYMDLGVRHLSGGQKQDALAAFLKAEKLDHNNKDIQNQLGLTYFVFKKLSLSEKHFRNALSIDSEFTEARNNLARILVEKGQLPSARKELRIVFADLTFKDLASAHLNLGLTYFKEANYAAAATELEKSLKENRQSCFAMSTYARCFYELKNYTKAISLFDLAIPMCKKINFDEAHFYGALSYFKSGQRSKGIALMNETILAYNKGEYELKSREMLELMKLNRL